MLHCFQNQQDVSAPIRPPSAAQKNKLWNAYKQINLLLYRTEEGPQLLGPKQLVDVDKSVPHA